MEARISSAENIVGRHYNDPGLVRLALQTPGELGQGHKRLAMIGDAVIGLIIKLDSYAGGQTIGDTTARCQAVCNNARLAALGFTRGLGLCVIMNPSMTGPLPERPMATTVQAFVGAAYLDDGLEAARTVMRALNIID